MRIKLQFVRKFLSKFKFSRWNSKRHLLDTLPKIKTADKYIPEKLKYNKDIQLTL
ncbi:MAG: hypothetical protein KKF56_02245 [Nanoarchaeota archaeon]|nr:hypothetical protein [Nanoarchaeota archaeon]